MKKLWHNFILNTVTIIAIFSLAQKTESLSKSGFTKVIGNIEYYNSGSEEDENITTTSVPPRTFGIEGNQFVKDGSPFRYISGSFHYFRAVHQKWGDIMHKFKLAGLNAIQTYVEWSSHQPTSAPEYDFTGNLNLFEFLNEAARNDLLVILRPGPFIDAERDMGGLPPWLLWQKPNMQLRTTDLDYNYYVAQWFDYLLPKLVPHLYENGGPIIMVQVENEYGSFGCDKNYTTFLRNLFVKHLVPNVTLFTTDGAADAYLKCGQIPGVFATVDFGHSGESYKMVFYKIAPSANTFFNQGSPSEAFQLQSRYNKGGPLVNSEYYTGWLDHWQRPHSTTEQNLVVNTLDQILRMGASLNLYMFYGGTSFGFKAGANLDNKVFEACPTSYDYDAPLNEAGDPTTKYWRIRELLSNYVKVPTDKPKNSTKGAYGKVMLQPFAYLLQPHLLPLLDSTPISSRTPLSFEELKQGSGFVLYQTTVNFTTSDPVLLSIPNLKDRAYISVDEITLGILSRTENTFSLPIFIKIGGKLSILVENQGRPCYGPLIGESKGLGGQVTLGGRLLEPWIHYRLGELNAKLLAKYARKNELNESGIASRVNQGSGLFYYGNFTLPFPIIEAPLDTFVRFDGWSRGLLWVNGFNLGRYWPVVGPQQTLYLPGPLLRSPPDSNSFVLLELENSPDDCIPTGKSGRGFPNGCNIHLTDVHILNGPTPYNSTVISSTG